VLFVDSSGFAQFNFSTTNVGPYAVLVRLLSGNAASYAPTYHDNVTTWTASTPFSGNPGSNTIVLSITLQAATGTGNGSGGAGGGVFNGLPFTGSVGMAGIPVYLQDVNGNLLKVLYSRNDGSFNFTNLPFGDYGMRVELFGVPSTTYMFSLTNSNPTLQINFTLGTNGIAASINEADLTIVGTYPNPAKDWVRMQLKAKDGQTQTIRLRDLQGRLVYNERIAAGLSTVAHPFNLDTRRWEQVGAPRNLPPNLRPIKVEPKLDETGAKYLRNNEPEVWAMLAPAITIQPAKTSVTIKV
jgi:hypothetical protein